MGRGKGRGRALEGAGTLPSVGQRFDQADDEHDCGAEGVGMRVDMSDWAMVMEALEHIQCEEVNRVLKQKTIEALWELKGLEM